MSNPDFKLVKLNQQEDTETEQVSQQYVEYKLLFDEKIEEYENTSIDFYDNFLMIETDQTNYRETLYNWITNNAKWSGNDIFLLKEVDELLETTKFEEAKFKPSEIEAIYYFLNKKEGIGTGVNTGLKEVYNLMLPLSLAIKDVILPKKAEIKKIEDDLKLMQFNLESLRHGLEQE